MVMSSGFVVSRDVTRLLRSAPVHLIWIEARGGAQRWRLWFNPVPHTLRGPVFGPTLIRSEQPDVDLSATYKGSAYVHIRIDQGGNVTVLDSTWDDATAQGLSAWRFRPAHVGSTPVEVDAVVEIPVP